MPIEGYIVVTPTDGEEYSVLVPHAESMSDEEYADEFRIALNGIHNRHETQGLDNISSVYYDTADDPSVKPDFTGQHLYTLDEVLSGTELQ